jgi:hypothetical protein
MVEQQNNENDLLIPERERYPDQLPEIDFVYMAPIEIRQAAFVDQNRKRSERPNDGNALPNSIATVIRVDSRNTNNGRSYQ